MNRRGITPEADVLNLTVVHPPYPPSIHIALIKI